MEAKSREQELEAAGFIVSMVRKQRKTSWYFYVYTAQPREWCFLILR